MADNKVDSIILEIETTSNKAEGGIDKTIKSLNGMLKVTEGIDPKKLEAIKNCMTSLAQSGDKLKSAGDGMRGIGTSIKSMAGVDTEKLKEIANAIDKIGNSLGNLGSNNKISIRMDSSGIKETVKSLEEIPTVIKDSSKFNVSAWRPQNFSVDTNADTTGLTNLESASQGAQAAMDSAASSAERLSTAEDKVGQSGQTAASGQQAFNNNVNQTNVNSANAKIQSLISQINKYKDTIRGMESGKQMFDTEQYTEAINGLEKAKGEFKNFQESIKSAPKTMEDVSKSIASIGQAAEKCGLGTFSSLLNGIATILPNIEIGGMAANAGFQSMAVGLQAVQAAIPIIGIILTLITTLVNVINSAVNKVKSAIDKAKAHISSFVRKLQQGFRVIQGKFKEFNQNLKESIGISDDSFKEVRKKIRSFTRLFTFMLLRKALTKLFEQVQTGFNNLVRYSNRAGTEFHRAVNNLYSDIHWLGNSFATAFEPILNYIAPILDMLITKLVQATQALAQFFSALTGQKFYTKAIKNNEDYAASLEDAAEAQKDFTTGIDELNILNDDSGNKNNGGANPGDMFETVEVDEKFKNIADMIKEAWEKADFYDIGRIVGEKLKEALDNIPWNGIKKTLRKIAKSIATFLNGFLETPGLFTSIGKTVAEAINSAFEFVDEFAWQFHWDSLGTAVMDAIEGALDNLDWDVIDSAVLGVASGITNFLNACIDRESVWIKLGKAISNAINSAITYCRTIITGLHWGQLGTDIGKALGEAIKNIDYDGLGVSFAGFVNGVFTAVLNFSKTFPWKDIALNFASGVNTALEKLDWTTIKSGFTAFAAGVATNLSTAITNINWTLVGKTLGNGINTLFSGIGAFLKNIDFKKIGSDIANAINSAVKTINWKEAGTTINSLVNGVCDLINAVIDEVDWFALLSGIGTAMAQVDWDKILATVFKVFATKWTFKKMFSTVKWTVIGTSIVGGIYDGITSAISGVGEWIYTHMVKPVVDAVKKALGIKTDGGDSEKMDELGKNTVSGFLKGVSYAALPMPLKIWALFGKVVSLIKEKLGIHSPSTVFEEIGTFSVEGFINGITGKFADCKTKILEWASKIKDWFNGTSFGKINKDTFTNYANDIITGFKDKVGNTYTTVKDNVTTWAGKVRDWFNGSSFGKVNKDQWSTYANDVITGFKEKVGNTYTQTKDNITTWADKARDWFSGSGFGKINSSTWQSYAENIITGFNTKVGNAYTTTKDNITTWASNLRDWFSGSSYGNINNSKWTTFAGNIITGFKDKIGLSYTDSKSNMTTWASNLRDWFVGSSFGNITSSKWSTYASDIITGFKNKIGSSYTDSKSNITTWANSVKDWFNNPNGSDKDSIVTSFKNIGKNIIQGFIDGVNSLWDKAMEVIKNFGKSIISKGKEGTDEHSPSRAFREIGAYVVEGFNLGIEDEKQSSLDLVSSWASSFSNVEIGLNTRFRINGDSLKDYQNNYGSDFSNESIIQRVTRSVNTTGAVQAVLESGGGLKTAIIEALNETGLLDSVSDTATNTKIQADKNEQIKVEIGGREVEKTVTTQRAANGFQFATT